MQTSENFHSFEIILHLQKYADTWQIMLQNDFTEYYTIHPSGDEDGDVALSLQPPSNAMLIMILGNKMQEKKYES